LLEQNKNPKKKVLQKVRQCFIFEQQYFLVETYLNIDGKPSFLRIETSKEHKELKIPEFLCVVREVTHDDHYSSQTMADQEYKMPASDKKAIKEGKPAVVEKAK